MSIATMNRLSAAKLQDITNKEAARRKTQIYTASVIIRQTNISVSIMTLGGMLRTRRTFNGTNLDACQALFKKFNVTKVFWS